MLAHLQRPWFLAAVAALLLVYAIMRLMAAMYARAEDTTMSVSAPVAMNVRASTLPVCALAFIIAPGTLADMRVRATGAMTLARTPYR